jgi:hypothetical protein
MRSEVGFRHTPGFGAISMVRAAPRRNGGRLVATLVGLAGVAGLVILALGAYADQMG